MLRPAASPRPVVMAFLKAPRPGLVKTRLGRGIGHREATRLYQGMAERQLAEVPPGFVTEVHYAPRGAATEMRGWLGGGFSYFAQRTGDLGRRLRHAFARGFQSGKAPRIAIGADCPGLDGACFIEAAERLKEADVVLGPAVDGGYYLIGLRRPEPQLFADIPWSTPAVMETTLARVRSCGLSCQLLPAKEDIDDLASLRRHLNRRASARVSAGPGPISFMGFEPTHALRGCAARSVPKR